MGFSLFLEVSNGDVFRVLRPDKHQVGDEVASFLLAYPDEELDFNKDEIDWFKSLEERANTDIRLLRNVIFSGQWNYTIDDWDKYSKKNRGETKEQFIKNVEAIQSKWTPINNLIDVVKEVIELLPRDGDEKYWYSPTETIVGFESLLDTLRLAKERSLSTQDVRIRID